MYFHNNLFAELAARVRGGDLEAREQLRQELQNALVLMVRQTLRGGKNATPIGRRILSVARRLSARQGGMFHDAEEFEREVAHNVCDEVVARLQPSPDGYGIGDSVRSAAQGATLVMC